jgi:hypothetical protein
LSGCITGGLLSKQCLFLFTSFWVQISAQTLTNLTQFVCILNSLQAISLADHPVTLCCINYIIETVSVRPQVVMEMISSQAISYGVNISYLIDCVFIFKDISLHRETNGSMNEKSLMTNYCQISKETEVCKITEH